MYFLQHLGMFDVITLLTFIAVIYYSQGGFNMQCPKCRGRMYAEKYYDFVRSFDAWKCTCCGEVIDSVIIANRCRNLTA
jgi:uncharacterized protein (DUF983 family)